MKITNKKQKRENMKKRNLNKLKLIGLFSCILVLLIFSLNFIFAAEQYKPYIHKPSVVQSPKLQMYGNYQTQLFSGSISYSYDLIVPKGINGLDPKLSISYNSQSALQTSGVMGSGWSITSSYVSRNVNYTINSTNDDYFILNLGEYSEKLVYRNGSYKTNIDNYLKIENMTSGGNVYWIVTSTDGTKYRFGYKTDSYLNSNSSNYTLKWFLDSVQEVHGNVINYSYSKNPFVDDKGAVYLSNITYNNDQLKKIVFRYESSTRPDKILVSDQGDKLLISRRMSGIEIYFNNSLIRRYALAYKDLNTEKTITSLANITSIGADNSSLLHLIQFDYYDSQPGFSNSSSWLVPEEFASITTYSKDLSLRFVDVNNDGFVDLIKSNSTSNYTKLNDKNSTWNSTSLFSVPEQIVNSSDNYRGVYFIDINRDGLSDLIRSQAGIRRVYINNGTDWKNMSNWSIPIDFVNGTSGDEGVRFVDLNGDGLIDLLQSKEIGDIKTAWLNNGSGWINVSSSWVCPDYFIGTGGNDTGLREIDLNRDGLTDLIKGGEPGLAWINNGTGWENNTLFRPSLNFTSTNNPDLGVRFMDINGDNLPDVIQNFFSNVSYLNQTCFNITNSTQNCTLYNVTTLTNIKINNGTGWVYSPSWSVPESFTYNGYNTGRRIADLNGDGYSDIIVGYRNGTFYQKTYLRNATSSFLLKRIKNEYGGINSITYNKSTVFQNGQNMGFNIWLTNNLTLNNSLSGIFSVNSKTRYNYYGGQYDYKNSEFLGFNIVNETSPDGTITSHYYYQDPVLKGKEYSTKIYGQSNKLYTENSKLFTNSSDNKIFLNVSTEYSYEGNPTAVITNITYNYDSYGNILSVNYSGNVAVSGDEKLEKYYYFYNTSAYIVSKLSNYSLYNSSSSIVKQTFYYYDNLINSLTKGDLTRVVKYNNLGQSPENNYTYDSYGNVIQEIDPLRNTNNYTYDSETNTFLIKETNALGQSQNYVYEKGTGNLLRSSDSNGIYTNYTYDTFGRNTKEILPLDSLTYPTKRTTYEFDGSAPEKITVETKNNDSSYSEIIYFYDGFSKIVQAKIKYDSNKQIVKSYIYDNKSRVIEEETPYFENYSVQINNSYPGYLVKYRYDSLDRVINITYPDNNQTRLIFNNTKVISINENGIQKEYLIDAYRRITNVYEHNRNSSGNDEIYNTSYYYDASDNLIKIIDSQGNAFVFEYDSLGRKISYDDPDINEWIYNYDSNNNLINQTDGRSTTISLKYDKLNRLVNKSSGNTTVNLFYDNQLNGTLSSINYSTYSFDPVYYQYIYDNRSRLVGEKLYFDSVFVLYNGSKDVKQTDLNYWINLSSDYDSSNKVIRQYFPNQTFDYLWLTGSNLTTSRTFPNSTIIYNYNLIGKIDNIANFVNKEEYTALNSMSNKTYFNGVVTKYDYDTRSRVNKIYSSIQNLTYYYDATGNVKQTNDSKNNLVYSMNYDDLDRLTKTIIYDYNTFEHEKYLYNYNKIGNILSTITDTMIMNYSYNSSKAHAPSLISKSNRNASRIEISLINPTITKNVSRYTFFNFTTQVCCRDNDCWGINVSLDPEEHTFTPTSETLCKDGICTQTIYSKIKFVYENSTWKKIEESSSLKGVWTILIKEDPDFPVKIIDYNYTTLTLNLSNAQLFRTTSIPLKVYNKLNNSEKPKDNLGNIKDKDTSVSIANNGWKTTTIDISDTKENLLDQEIKWGDHSTIITVYDNSSINTDDSYIRDDTPTTNYGTNAYVYVRNYTSSNENILIRWDISQLPRQALIDDAKLVLYTADNNLGSGHDYNVSIFSINQPYSWNESTVIWNNGPIETNITLPALDKVNILNTDTGKYFSWNVTSAIQNKNKNQSFYLVATGNNGAGLTAYIRFRSKDYSGAAEPYLNVTYRLKGMVSNTIGETPFYSTVKNPYYIDLEQNQCQNVTWAVNATGSQGNYLFFAYANKTYDIDMYNSTDLINVNII
jgi:YD repeat-containing protein